MWIHRASRGDVGNYKVVIASVAGRITSSSRVRLKTEPPAAATAVKQQTAAEVTRDAAAAVKTAPTTLRKKLEPRKGV